MSSTIQPATEEVELSLLAQLLVQQGLLSKKQAAVADKRSKRDNIRLVTYLVKNGLIDSLALATVASQEFSIPLFNIDALEIDSDTIHSVSEKLIRQHQILPLVTRGNRLYVGITDPANIDVLNEIKFHVGKSVEPVLVAEDRLRHRIDSILNKQSDLLPELDNVDLEVLDISADQGTPDESIVDKDVDDAPVVRFINKIILDAIQKGASDIHFEPYEKDYRVRYRIDGILNNITSPPVSLGRRLASRIKVMSRLDISERRIPQDGRIKLTLSKNRNIDIRVATCPTMFGEKVVLRLLDPATNELGIDTLGMDARQKEVFLKTIHRPQGMVLVTGPTGSGKTVSLYSALNILNTEHRNISTAEDPVEIYLPGINQVSIYPKVGLTFANALRSFLRQDPDVIMVGEIRDLETAEIAIKAAQTGHMVLSTLHTNDAPQTLTRLVNMGVENYNIASSVNLIIAQRLVRNLCPRCKRPDNITEEELLHHGFKEEQLTNITIYKATGCEYCTGGYKGRSGIFQVMPITEAISKIIMQGANAHEISSQADKEGIKDLRAAGLEKVAQGVTSLEEITRITIE